MNLDPGNKTSFRFDEKLAQLLEHFLFAHFRNYGENEQKPQFRRVETHLATVARAERRQNAKSLREVCRTEQRSCSNE